MAEELDYRVFIELDPQSRQALEVLGCTSAQELLAAPESVARARAAQQVLLAGHHVERFKNESLARGYGRALADQSGTEWFTLRLEERQALWAIARQQPPVAPATDLAQIGPEWLEASLKRLRELGLEHPLAETQQELLRQIAGLCPSGASRCNEGLLVPHEALDAFLALPAWQDVCPSLDTQAFGRMLKQREGGPALCFTGNKDCDHPVHVKAEKGGWFFSFGYRRPRSMDLSVDGHSAERAYRCMLAAATDLLDPQAAFVKRLQERRDELIAAGLLQAEPAPQEPAAACGN